MKVRKLDILGKIITEVRYLDIADPAQVMLTTSDGRVYMMDHEQDCCEYVFLYDIIGDINDIVGAPLVMAEEVIQKFDWQKDDVTRSLDDSATWTFYKFATVKGYVTMRWIGTSNGYYSESVRMVDRTNAICAKLYRNRYQESVGEKVFRAKESRLFH